MAVMEVACPGAPGSAAGQQKELAKAKEKTPSKGKKQSPIYKLEAVEKSPVFCGKWEILNDVITKGTAKEGSEGGLAAISIIAQAECENSQEFSPTFSERIFIAGSKQFRIVWLPGTKKCSVLGRILYAGLTTVAQRRL